MTVSAAMIDHLKSNVTWLCEVAKVVAKDGSVAAYAVHQRNILYNSVTYQSAPVEMSISGRKLGLEPDDWELKTIFDDIVTEASIYAGKWKGARVTKELISYLNPSISYATKETGFIGKLSPLKTSFEAEVLSLASLLSQEIGDLTSPLDRRRRLDELGIVITSYTHATTIFSVTNQMKFRVNYVQPSANYFQGGTLKFTSGLNNTIEMEIKSSTTISGKTEIETQLAMPYNPANGDAVTLYRGYDGTRETATALGVAISFQGEPDTPGLTELFTYPSS